LTGLLNRNGIYATLNRMSYRDPKHPIAVMILDIDYFKVINDTFGHPFGDKCLISLADALVSSVRPNDAVGRWGGEEMIVVFDGLSDAEEVQDVVARVFFLTSGTIKLSENSVLTYSAGYAFGFACDFHTLLEKADKGLYLAKHNGRNCFINAMESVDVENLEAKKVGHYAGI
jgi:diguanylate cyclase (GGDEF)-like protein